MRLVPEWFPVIGKNNGAHDVAKVDQPVSVNKDQTGNAASGQTKDAAAKMAAINNAFPGTVLPTRQEPTITSSPNPDGGIGVKPSDVTPSSGEQNPTEQAAK